MNISFNWIKELIEVTLEPESLAKALTRVGLAVEGIHPNGDDLIFDIDLTSNRSDCLSHLGIAREIAAITTQPMRVSELSVETLALDSGDPNSNMVTMADADICRRFTARIIKNVKVGPSPDWMVQRLEALGERSINNIADITNYVMLELGQPMHAFDLDRLSEKRIVVRRAKNGESIRTLDEIDRELDDSVLAICDADKPVAIAGIMGGLDSAITDDTVNVLLEVAYFQPANIRLSSRKLGLASQASYRFERGVDIENLIRASNRAVELIRDLAGGIAEDLIDVYPRKFTPANIVAPDISKSVKRLTGLAVDAVACDRILDTLGISKVVDTGNIAYLSPSWRHDISIEEDLVEEIARYYGYENIADELPPAYGAGEYQPTEMQERQLRRTLTDSGFDEAVTYSFIDTKFDSVILPVADIISDTAADAFVTLNDSVIEGAVRMRHTLLPGLLDSVRLNLSHQLRDIKLFEIGKVFAAAESQGLPVERKLLSLAVTGGDIYENRGLSVRPLDFYDVKGYVESALSAVGLTDLSYAAADVLHLRPGQSASIALAGKSIGYVGRISDDIAAHYKFKQAVFVAEIDLRTALANPVVSPIYTPLSKFPSVIRDVSFIAKREITYAAIADAIDALNVRSCRSVKFIDVYEGPGIANDQRSITIRLEYQSDQRTLTEDEVDVAHRQMLADLDSKLGIHVRL